MASPTRTPTMSNTATAQGSNDPAPAGATTLSSQQLAAWRAFLEAHRRVIDVLARELRDEEDLPLTYYDVLVHLSEADGHVLRMQELADAILLSRSGLTRLIDRMERAGLVRREACETDGRGTLACMTGEGLAVLRRAAPTHIRGVEQAFARHLDDDEATLLATAMRRIADTESDA